MIKNRYNYPTPPIRDINGKEIQTRNNWILMETSLAESQTDSYFPTKWSNGYPKQKDVSDTHIQRRTITKINHDRRTALGTVSKKYFTGGGGAGGLKSILCGHNPRPYFCRGLDTQFVHLCLAPHKRDIFIKGISVKPGLMKTDQTLLLLEMNQPKELT